MHTTVDVWFRLQGTHAPSLHGHALYAAVCAHRPECHGAEWLGIHTLHGQRDGDRRIRLLGGTRLGVRGPAEHLPYLLGLVGKTLDLEGLRLNVGVPEVHPLGPAARVSARMVTIKGFDEPASFAEACERQLAEIDVVGTLEVGPRLVQRIHGKKIVGFGVRITELSANHSVTLQAKGIGGRRRFGCGLFRPSAVPE